MLSVACHEYNHVVVKSVNISVSLKLKRGETGVLPPKDLFSWESGRKSVAADWKCRSSPKSLASSSPAAGPARTWRPRNPRRSPGRRCPSRADAGAPHRGDERQRSGRRRSTTGAGPPPAPVLHRPRPPPAHVHHRPQPWGAAAPVVACSGWPVCATPCGCARSPSPTGGSRLRTGRTRSPAPVKAHEIDAYNRRPLASRLLRRKPEANPDMLEDTTE